MKLLLLVLIGVIVFSIYVYLKLKKATKKAEKNKVEQQKIQDCIVYLLKKQEMLICLQEKNLNKEEILTLNHCVETMCIQLSTNKFTLEKLPLTVVEEYSK